ncbi:MAG: hypothetical protein ACK48U_04890, partial [Planctomyces sp.]
MSHGHGSHGEFRGESVFVIPRPVMEIDARSIFHGPSRESPVRCCPTNRARARAQPSGARARNDLSRCRDRSSGARPSLLRNSTKSFGRFPLTGVVLTRMALL